MAAAAGTELLTEYGTTISSGLVGLGGVMTSGVIAGLSDTSGLAVGTVPQVRDLRGVIEREKAAIGVFICIEKPTAPMRAEAADAGFFQAKNLGDTKHPRLQILTIEDLLDGKKIDLPMQQDLRSFKQAPKVKKETAKNLALNFGQPEE